MSFLKIRINVDIVYKPTYKPLQAQMLAISIAQSEMNDMLLNYWKGNVGREELEKKINSITTPYKISSLGRTFGKEKISGEEAWIMALDEKNEMIKIEVIV